MNQAATARRGARAFAVAAPFVPYAAQLIAAPP